MERSVSVRADRVPLAAREWAGGERGVLLIHGLASSSHIWDLVAPLLARRFHVVAYDQRGHGRSGKPASGYGFERVASDAVAVMRSTALARPVVVGHSWGGNVALELAVRHPRLVAGAILLDGGFLNLRDRMDWPTAKERLAPPDLKGTPVHEFLEMIRYFHGGRIEITPEVEAVFLSLMRVDPQGNIHPRLSRANHVRILRALWAQDARELLGRVRVPTLVLSVRSSSDVPDSSGLLEEKERAARKVRRIGEPVRLEWIDGIHDIPLQRPAVVAARIGRFVDRTVG
jgi:pimeloyl-ACP methyl ester carboxylesterase